MLGLHDVEYIVILKVASIKRSKEFYAKKLGLKVILSDDKSHRMFKSRPQICLDQLGSPSKYTPRHLCSGSAEIHFFSQKTIQELEYILGVQKIPIIANDKYQTEEGGEQECIYLYDPDGNLLRITGGANPRI